MSKLVFCYLAGPHDNVSDGSNINWQTETIGRLAEYGVIGITPLITAAILGSRPPNISIGRMAMSQNNMYIAISKAVIFNFLPDIFTFGTIQEVKTAYDLGIPLRIAVVRPDIRSIYMDEQVTHIVHTLDEAIQIIIDNIWLFSDTPCAKIQPNEDPVVKIKFDPGVKELYEGGLPSHSKNGDACYDIYVSEDTIIQPAGITNGDPTNGVADIGVYTNVPGGLSVELPENYWMEIRPRSSTSRVRQIHVPHAVIDQQYRGPIYVQAVSMTGHQQIVKRGERIGQFRISKIRDCQFIEVDELAPSERGDSGFGSSGK